MALKPPPKYANMPAGDLFDRGLPDGVFRTLAQLHALAWQNRGEQTPPATVLELARLRGLKERQMYNHLRELKKRGRIRVEHLGDGRIIIYPLRWDLGAALPADEQSSITESELAELIEEAALPLRWEEGAALPEAAGGQEIADWPAQDSPLNGVAKNCSNAPPPEAVTAKFCSSEPPGEQVTAKNCSRLLQNGDFTAKNCSRTEHVVVDSNLNHEEQQHEHGGATAKNCSKPELRNPESLAGAIAEVFIGDGAAPTAARRQAAELIERYGAARCRRQLEVFPLRCDLARASPRGLGNPSGLLIASIRQNWGTPSRSSQKTRQLWYTQEEFRDIILH